MTDFDQLTDEMLQRFVERARLAQATVNRMTNGFTCPVCGMTSHNPNDIREGYCGNCHTWTALGYKP
jgi:hypothetical protein